MKLVKYFVSTREIYVSGRGKYKKFLDIVFISAHISADTG